MKQVCVIIDGNSLAHRAFHAYGGAVLTDAYGRPQEVCYGFMRLLATSLDLIRARHDRLDHLVIAFDSPRNRRRDLDVGYKASRPMTDSALMGQLDRLKALLDGAGITWAEVEGWEADDLLAASARRVQAVGARAVLVTSDRDALGCVGPGVEVLQIRNGMAQARFLNETGVLDTYGVTPDRYFLLAALRGDPSDDLPGVPGLGPKKAALLAGAHADLEAMLADPNLARMVGPKAASALAAHQGAVRRNLSLMAPRDDLTVPILTSPLPSLARVVEALATHELPGLIRGTAVSLAAGGAGTVSGVPIRRLD